MAQKKSMKGKGYYARYRNEVLVSKHKSDTLKRHCNKHPDDMMARKALNAGDFKCRKSSYGKIWNSGNKFLASLFKKAGLKGSQVLKIDSFGWALPQKNSNQ